MNSRDDRTMAVTMFLTVFIRKKLVGDMDWFIIVNIFDNLILISKEAGAFWL